MLVKITPTGLIETVYRDSLELRDLGKVVIRRASTVEPTEDGWWEVRREGGESLGKYHFREIAIGVEVKDIEERMRGNEGLGVDRQS